jgi:hypothetical protein
MSGTSATTSSTGSQICPVDLARDDLGVRELQLVALAAHRLDEDGELQLAAAEHDETVGRLGVSTRIARFFSASRSSRSLRWRLVRYLLSLLLPAKGEVLTPKRILIVGSSTTMRGRASGRSAVATVSPIVTFSMPARPRPRPRPRSPRPPASGPRRRRASSRCPCAARRRRARADAVGAQGAAHHAAHGQAAHVVVVVEAATIICRGASGSPEGAGTRSTMVSRAARGPSRCARARAWPGPTWRWRRGSQNPSGVVRPRDRRRGRRPRRAPRRARASLRSILLMTTITGKPRSRPCGARSASAGAGLRPRRRAAARRRPSSACARPRRRSRRGRGCRRC